MLKYDYGFDNLKGKTAKKIISMQKFSLRILKILV